MTITELTEGKDATTGRIMTDLERVIYQNAIAIDFGIARVTGAIASLTALVVLRQDTGDAVRARLDELERELAVWLEARVEIKRAMRADTKALADSYHRRTNALLRKLA